MVCAFADELAQLPSPAPDGGYPNQNTAEGDGALFSLTTGPSNTAMGTDALYSNTTGDNNTATGNIALYNNTTGGSNTAVGSFALTAISGSGNIALGAFAGQNLTAGDFNIDIGNEGVAVESNTIRIGTQGTEKNVYRRYQWDRD
jgi:hypothetical protein